ncbi:hypothetical protein AJ78_07080 [Emergomyces pasteurianus Ep9510]|uniref:C2H2-type domain-containing protein n=1 Tax=Emergomyces pasteurianus Ep9510 TaxID=1447872 RepID=A0A1J9P6J6_9EURO|nr:hypothetical protein AJ78_07080 [Emergomyces pasteurianus Ep9510]
MVQKRKATSEIQRQSKRLQKSAATESSDVVDNGDLSDSESQSSYCLSHGDQQDTPITPNSPASSRYPSDRKTHLCPYEGCFKAFNRPARLTEHLRSHTNERIFSCTYKDCDKTFLRASHLSHHVKSAHTTIRDYVCDREGCGKSFVTGSRLRRHLAAHEGRDKYRCTEYLPCNDTFRKHSTLQKHILTVHLNKKPFPCPHIDPVTGHQCTQAFDTAGHLRAHESRLHGGARFACAECTSNTTNEQTSVSTNGMANPYQHAVFQTYALLQAHMKSVHPPTCPECTMTCTSARDLRRHLEITHGTVPLEERKIYPCHYPNCGRNFTKRGNLNVHIKTVHEGEKRFICGETDLSNSKKIEGWNAQDKGCGKRYGSKLALEEHVRTAHLGLKNVKAERRELLGLNSSSSSSSRSRSRKDATKNRHSQSETPSNLAMLTGEGYVEESGRHIPCLLEQCAHRFHRDYDLWLHMASRHNLEETDIQILFMQRAMQGGEQSFDFDFENTLKYEYGYGYATGSGAGADAGNGNDVHTQDLLGDEQLVVGKGQGLDNDTLAMVDCTIDSCVSTINGGGDTDMALIDPVLTFTEEQQAQGG